MPQLSPPVTELRLYRFRGPQRATLLEPMYVSQARYTPIEEPAKAMPSQFPTYAVVSAVRLAPLVRLPHAG